MRTLLGCSCLLVTLILLFTVSIRDIVTNFISLLCSGILGLFLIWSEDFKQKL